MLLKLHFQNIILDVLNINNIHLIYFLINFKFLFYHIIQRHHLRLSKDNEHLFISFCNFYPKLQTPNPSLERAPNILQSKKFHHKELVKTIGRIYIYNFQNEPK